MCRKQMFLIFANDSRSEQNIKNPEHAFVDIGKQETCVNLSKRILSAMAVGTCQSFQFLRHIPGFLKTI